MANQWEAKIETLINEAASGGETLRSLLVSFDANEVNLTTMCSSQKSKTIKNIIAAYGLSETPDKVSAFVTEYVTTCRQKACSSAAERFLAKMPQM
jgi:hypothetical protein